MNHKTRAIRIGFSRGMIELKQSFTNGADLWAHFFWPILMLVAVFFLNKGSFGNSGLLLGTIALPSIFGMNAAFGLISLSQQLVVEREDGTLLRAKATPDAMVSYLVGKIVSVSLGLVFDLAVFLIPGLFLVPDLSVGSPGAWLLLIGLLALGMLATLPIGAVLGSVFTSARGQGLIQLPIFALMAISGIFYPITSMPDWVQWIAQVFPIYWLGLGMRSALLPDSAVNIEIAHSWRHLETVGVLGLWAVLGLVLAPIVLRKMASRESGSSVVQRREKALQRTV